MKTYLNRRQLLVGAGMGAIGTAVAAGAAPASVFAADEKDAVEGGWYIKVHAVGLPDFDALYSFAKGGVFTRIDGRNNAPAVGSWRHTDDHEFVFSFILFNFTGAPSPATRNGAIVGKLAARVDGDMMTGRFTADGIQGFSFHRAGTFTGTRIAAVGP